MAVALGQCEKGKVYKVRARNFGVAVYDGRRGFVGIREKFGEEYLFTEYFNDGTNPVGTATPVRLLGEISPGIKLECWMDRHPDDKYMKINWDLFHALEPYVAKDDQENLDGLTPEERSQEEAREVQREERRERLLAKTFVRESNLIEGIDSAKADKDCFEAWMWLRQQDRITHQGIQYLQRLITDHQEEMPARYKGVYRDEPRINVSVGGRSCPPFFDVRPLMDDWLDEWLDLDWQEAHVKFEHIHPFADGNGRTGRMLMNWQRLQDGLPVIVIRADERWDYYDWFSSPEEAEGPLWPGSAYSAYLDALEQKHDRS
jgi:hypothetical protein